VHQGAVEAHGDALASQRPIQQHPVSAETGVAVTVDGAADLDRIARREHLDGDRGAGGLRSGHARSSAE
jgi:hypothetical protein